MGPVPMIVGAQIIGGISDVVIDSLVDATADYMMSVAQQYINEKFPNGQSTGFINTLITQMRMGVMARTQASFMMTASSVNGRITQKVQNGVTAYKDKLKSSRGGFMSTAGMLNLSSGGKLNKELRNAGVEHEKSQQSYLQAVHNGSIASANEAHAFGNGTGSLKSAYVQSKNTPLQNNKISIPELKSILNGMGYFPAPQGL
ncbi:MAG: hypothetical protein NTX05_06030 [Fusobacteria bacterium]|nr:hypothetical protein [Fusobacteriota bacterium]